MLTTSYNGALWNTGQFTTVGGTAPTAVQLGWIDNGTAPNGTGAQNVTVMATLRGDTNLDGSVNLGDLNTLISNFGTGTTWAQGDFRYTGTTNLTDLNNLVANFGKTAPISSAVVIAGPGVSMVPEPLTLVLLAAGLIGLLAYAWRKRN